MNNLTKKINLGFFRSSVRKLLVKSSRCILLVLMLFVNPRSYSQNVISRAAIDYPTAVRTLQCNTSPYTGCIITLGPATVGSDYIFKAKLKQAGLDSHSASFLSNPCGNSVPPTTSYPGTGLDLTVTVPASMICASDPAFTNNFIDVTVSVDQAGELDEQVFRILLPRKAVKVAMVLDISGSMSLPTPGDLVDYTPRWDVLKTAVKTFAEKFETSRLPGDSLALTYFTTYTIQPVFATNHNFIEITTSDLLPASNRSSSIIDTDLNLPGRHPLYTTAMGLGLMDGRSKLRNNNTAPDGANKIVVLFTDGLQNVYPRVTTDGVTLEDARKLNDCNPCTLPQQIIHYHTISMGAGMDVPIILKTIALANSGLDFNSTIGDGAELNDFFTQHWQEIVNPGSPQTLSRKRGDSVAGSVSHTFTVNNNVNTILFELLSRESDSMTINIAKDDENLIPSINYHDANHKLAGFRLPHNYNGNVFKSGGDWEVILKGNSDKKYSLTCLVDDYYLDYELSLNKSIFTVGDSIRFSGKLYYAGEPVKPGIFKVEAVVLKPGDDLGDLLSNYATPDTLQLNDVEDPAQQKFQILLNSDSSFYHSLLPAEQIVELVPDTMGIYSGSFASTELCGIYRIIYLLKGDIPLNGHAERTKLSEALFVFGNVEEETPIVVHNPPAPIIDSTKYKNLTAVQVKPRNKYGHLMGPGFKSVIKVVINPPKKINSASMVSFETGSSGAYVKEIKDNLDGSYLIYIADIPKNTNPNIRISIRGETLYEGKICPLPCWVKILIILLILLVIAFRFLKAKGMAIYNVILWFISLIVLIIILLHYFGIIRLFC